MLNGNKVTVKVVCANDGTEQTARARTSGKQISVFYTCSTQQFLKRDFPGNLEMLYDAAHLRFQYEGGKRYDSLNAAATAAQGTGIPLSNACLVAVC